MQVIILVLVNYCYFSQCSAILMHERIMSGSFCISREYVSIDNVSSNINCINFLLKSLVTNYQDYLRLKRQK